MKLSKKPFDPKSLGYFVLFSITSEPKFQVSFLERSSLRATVSIGLPGDSPEKWLSGFCVILRQLQCGKCWPVRLEYDNAILYFSQEELQKVEKANSTIPFCLYSVPRKVADAQECSSLNFDQIRNKLARERYAAEKEQRVLERNLRLSTGNTQ